MMWAGVAGGPPGQAVITGASSGIGEALAMTLAARGWSLELLGRSADRLDAVAARCRAYPAAGPVRWHAVDVRDRAGMEAVIAAIGTIDLFVANAAILDGRRAGERVESGDVAAEVLTTNLNASVMALHMVLPAMRARRSGRILIVSSLAALAPLADAPAYSASKAALLSYGLALGDAVREENVSVTVALPGYVATAMAAQHCGSRPMEISPDCAAELILRASFRGRSLCAFPQPLAFGARISAFLPSPLRRLVNRTLRFTVDDRQP